MHSVLMSPKIAAPSHANTPVMLPPTPQESPLNTLTKHTFRNSLNRFFLTNAAEIHIDFRLLTIYLFIYLFSFLHSGKSIMCLSITQADDTRLFSAIGYDTILLLPAITEAAGVS